MDVLQAPAESRLGRSETGREPRGRAPQRQLAFPVLFVNGVMLCQQGDDCGAPDRCYRHCRLIPIRLPVAVSAPGVSVVQALSASHEQLPSCSVLVSLVD